MRDAASILLGSCLVLSSIPVQEEGKKVPIPPEDAQKEALKLIRDVFKEEYSRRAVPDRRTFAKKLLQQGIDTGDDRAAQYVLLEEARALAAEIGDAETALRAVEELSRRFEVDALKLKWSSLSTVGLASRGAGEFARATRAMLDLCDEALRSEDHETAGKALSSASSLAKGAKSIPLVMEVESKSKLLDESKARMAKLKRAQEDLSRNPDDAESNLVVGEYLCFVRGDWEKGLPLLARCSRPPLKAAALLDLSNPLETAKLVEAGDAWWDLGEKETGETRNSVRKRAVFWYVQALPRLAGLSKVKVEKRLAAFDPKLELGPGVDLLKLIDPVRDTVKGTWEIREACLYASAGGAGIISIPYRVPEEYELRVVVEVKGPAEINLGLVLGGAYFVVPVDGWYGKTTGIENIDGKGADANETTRNGRVLRDDAPNTIVCAVRKSRVTLTVNENILVDWAADPKRLSIPGWWDRPHDGTLALGSMARSYRVTKLELVPLSGQGQRTR